MDFFGVISPINHIGKICLSCGVEILTDKWDNADNIFILKTEEYAKMARIYGVKLYWILVRSVSNLNMQLTPPPKKMETDNDERSRSEGGRNGNGG